MKMLPWQLAEIKYAFYIYFFIILVNIYFISSKFFYGVSFKDNNYKL